MFTAGKFATFPSGAVSPSARGYGRDPDLLHPVVPWPKTLTSHQLCTASAVCDVVLPAEPPHPSAATVRVQDFIDEWVSAPYPRMQEDRRLVLEGLAELDSTAERTWKTLFAESTVSQQTQIFGHFCSRNNRNTTIARRLIQLVCAGYYTTREGMAAIGYVGNVALTSFPGTPEHVASHLRVALDQI